ncbi:MAG: endonuclease/exonuclease/phosphatase family protein [Caulobacter sp.]|nr:endonuclease/exonuclease/phosphatase family protein [Caulobacter sp.]
MQSLFKALGPIVRLTGSALALTGAILSVAAQGGRFSDRLDALTHFAPFWLLLGLVGLLLWLLAGGRKLARPTPVFAAAAIVAAGGLMIPELTRSRGPAAPAEGETLKLIQFNLWGRAGKADGMVDWIAAQDADILVFEEAFARTGGVARALRARYPYQTTCADTVPCSTMILSRRKPVAHKGLGASDTQDWLSGAMARFRTERGEFTVIGVHYTWPLPAGPQQEQSRRLARVLDTLPRDSAIVAGDFNSTPWSFSLRRQDKRFGLDRRTHALASWPAAPFSRHRIDLPFPVLPIDQVYAGQDWKTVSVTRGPKLGSDHYPVVVVLRR